MSQHPTPIVTSFDTIVTGKKYDYIRLHITTPAGKALTREVVRHPGAVVVVPVLDDGRIVLIRNYRVSVRQWLLECCAGTIERSRAADGSWGAGEDPAACAGRELIEETGYEAARIIPLTSFLTTPGLTDERMYAFAATGLEHVGQHLEEDENIKVELVPAAEVLAMIDRGEMQDAKSMVAILLAHRHGLLGPTPKRP